MQGVPLFRLVAIVLVLTVVTSVIMLIPNWNGEAASTAAPDIDRLLDVAIVLSSFVFSIVMTMLGYCIYKFRAKPGDESDGEPIHGNTRVEIAWTVIPTVIVACLAAYSWIVLDDIEAEAADAMPITVTGQQFAWSFEYPDQGVQSDELHVVVDEQIAVEMRALDVLHSFWVPEWRIKRDAVPGAPGAGDRRRLRGHARQGGHLQPHLHRALRPRPRDDASARDRASPRRTSTSGSRSSRRSRPSSRSPRGLPNRERGPR